MHIREHQARENRGNSVVHLSSISSIRYVPSDLVDERGGGLRSVKEVLLVLLHILPEQSTLIVHCAHDRQVILDKPDGLGRIERLDLVLQSVRKKRSSCLATGGRLIDRVVWNYTAYTARKR